VVEDVLLAGSEFLEDDGAPGIDTHLTLTLAAPEHRQSRP
jgi:hypothetical protein